MSDSVIFIDDLTSSSVICVCRICLEQEFEGFNILEAPCACSGTLKFAHRDCIQRWCNEKGNTTCEICLQKLEPGYTVPPKESQLIHTTPTIRENELQNDYTGCISADNDGSSSCCRSVALILTSLLLMRHMFDVITGGAQRYPFSLLTVLTVEATGVVVPMYLLFRLAALICDNIKHHHYHGVPLRFSINKALPVATSLTSSFLLQNFNEDSPSSDNEDNEQLEGQYNA